MVENITPLQVTIHSYTSLFGEKHSIIFINMVHSAEFETVPFTIQIIQKSPTATFTSCPWQTMNNWKHRSRRPPSSIVSSASY
jgi:ABC-type antimicrobial peptide transport system ATPase subunit